MEKWTGFRKLLVLCMIVLIFGCRERLRQNSKEVSLVTEGTSNICFTNQERQSAIKAILSTEAFQTYLHPEAENRIPIQLEQNEFVTSDLKIISNGFQVVFKDSIVLPYGNVHRIRVDSIDCNAKSFFYSVFYPVEAAVIQGNVIESDSKWVAEVTHVGEKN